MVATLAFTGARLAHARSGSYPRRCVRRSPPWVVFRATALLPPRRRSRPRRERSGRSATCCSSTKTRSGRLACFATPPSSDPGQAPFGKVAVMARVRADRPADNTSRYSMGIATLPASTPRRGDWHQCLRRWKATARLGSHDRGRCFVRVLVRSASPASWRSGYCAYAGGELEDELWLAVALAGGKCRRQQVPGAGRFPLAGSEYGCSRRRQATGPEAIVSRYEGGFTVRRGTSYWVGPGWFWATRRSGPGCAHCRVDGAQVPRHGWDRPGSRSPRQVEAPARFSAARPGTARGPGANSACHSAAVRLSLIRNLEPAERPTGRDDPC
jgi:hypothetical protein